MQWVFDASVSMTWCFDDEKTPETETLLDRLIATRAVVPQVWSLEVANVLALAERKGRITVEQISEFIAMLTVLPINTDSETASLALTAIFETANQYQLTVYDAAYLELSTRLGIPLATLDADLRKAAGSANVPLL
jgi:predicted nucleic acid-binding protein